MTEDQKEELNHIAYSYRSWPGTDQAGVVARYDELVAYVENLINEKIELRFPWERPITPKQDEDNEPSTDRPTPK